MRRRELYEDYGGVEGDRERCFPVKVDRKFQRLLVEKSLDHPRGRKKDHLCNFFQTYLHLLVNENNIVYHLELLSGLKIGQNAEYLVNSGLACIRRFKKVNS